MKKYATTTQRCSQRGETLRLLGEQRATGEDDAVLPELCTVGPRSNTVLYDGGWPKPVSGRHPPDENQEGTTSIRLR